MFIIYPWDENERLGFDTYVEAIQYANMLYGIRYDIMVEEYGMEMTIEEYEESED